MNYLSTLHIKDSFVFIGSILLSVLIASPFIGFQGALTWTSFSVLCTYSLYNAKPDRSNLIYILFWMLLILASAYIGRLFHLSWKFYLYLYLISYLYYYFFGKDPVFDRAIRFIIILSTIGTAMPEITKGLPIGALIGTFSALVVCHYMLRKNVDLDAFKQGVFTYEIFKLHKNLILRALIYSSGMFLCLLLPRYFGIEKNYWATITFIMVMPPKSLIVFHNTLIRFIGSVIAVGVLYLLFQVPDLLPEISFSSYMIVLFLFFSFMLPLCFGKNFGITTFGVTCYSLILVELSMYWSHPALALLVDRVLETMIGGIIAILTSYILRVLHKT
ncbi:FUSC family protein [Ignatzschineria rhizosphaerae]|uniref:FUSC family protein n=1 Tax=Ignatzschineria rhizosphaerae TaxID=2923279 RepID=A0ABY3X2F6_9GAMM|nr:FUSC family protein [Ignatzschineria rhizosphaerae]UNM97062.1 FUSC family protein [Ignatzschineria rhizosphaerae]